MSAETLATGAAGGAEWRIPGAATRWLGGLAGVLAVAVFTAQVAPHVDRPLAGLRVGGELHHLTPLQVAAALQVAPGTRLFDVDLGGLRTRVEALPWVGHARVARLWPDGLIVEVQEREPLARWGAAALIDGEGRAFSPPAADLTAAAGLPLLSGPDERIADVLSAYQALAAALHDGPFALAGLSLDARGEWTAQTRGGVSLRLGQDEPVHQATLLNGAVTRSLASRLDGVAYVDLRYPNGFAVGWRDGSSSGGNAATVRGGQR